LVSLLMVGMNSAAVRAQKSTTWKLVWQGEFNAAKRSPVDSTKWPHDVVGGGWGNHELEYYTNRIENSYQADGVLVIKTIKESYSGTDGVTREYTSARLSTKKTFTATYGKFEARIKIPRGQGIWPAFWMLGADIDKAH